MPADHRGAARGRGGAARPGRHAADGGARPARRPGAARRRRRADGARSSRRASRRRARVARRDRARARPARGRVPDRHRGLPQARHRPGDRADPGRARARTTRAAASWPTWTGGPRSPGSTRSARRPRPGCRGRTGWRPTRSPRRSSPAAAPGTAIAEALVPRRRPRRRAARRRRPAPGRVPGQLAAAVRPSMALATMAARRAESAAARPAGARAGHVAVRGGDAGTPTGSRGCCGSSRARIARAGGGRDRRECGGAVRAERALVRDAALSLRRSRRRTCGRCRC